MYDPPSPVHSFSRFLSRAIFAAPAHNGSRCSQLFSLRCDSLLRASSGLRRLLRYSAARARLGKLGYCRLETGEKKKATSDAQLLFAPTCVAAECPNRARMSNDRFFVTSMTTSTLEQLLITTTNTRINRSMISRESQRPTNRHRDAPPDDDQLSPQCSF